MSDDLVREHVRKTLEAIAVEEMSRHDHIRQLEADGHRMIDGGQLSSGDDEVFVYESRDWRTRERIFLYEGHPSGLEDAIAEAEGSAVWFHIDQLDDVGILDVHTEGIPESLAVALGDWIDAAPAEELANWIGWPVDKVQHIRDAST